MSWQGSLPILARIPIILDMVQMNVSLPEGLKAWAEARVAEGLYSSTSDYVRDLMRRDMEGIGKLRELQAAIDDGRASGRSDKEPFAYLDTLREGIKAKAKG